MITKIICILLLLTVHVSAADFLDSEREIGQAAKLLLGYTTDAGATQDTVMSRWVKLSTIDVNNSTAALMSTDTIFTVEDQEAYAVDSAIVPIEVYIISNDSTYSLIRRPLSSFSKLYSSFTILEKGGTGWGSHSPYYDWMNNRLVLFPTPVKDDDTLIIESLKKIQNIESDTLYPAQLELHYRTAILYKTCFFASMAEQLQGAENWLALHDKSIAAINALVNSRFEEVQK